MKKMVTRSLMLVLGASIFLYSEYVFASTAIYDPLDPQNTITPVPNNDPETTTSLINEKSSTESSSAEISNAEIILEDTSNSEKLSSKEQERNQSKVLFPKDVLKKVTESNDFLPLNPYLPKQKTRLKNQILMLDDDFFSPINTSALPPDSGGGSAGAPNDFADIAQSAYLLSGVVLYGEANGKLETRMSDQFAG